MEADEASTGVEASWYDVQQERRRLIAMVEQRMAAQLESMRPAYEDDESEAAEQRDYTQQEDDSDKENIHIANETTETASRATAAPRPASTSVSPARPVSAAFIALATPPQLPSLTASATPFLSTTSLPPTSDPATAQLQQRHHQLQRQHTAVQLHLLSLHAPLLDEHRLTATLQHDTTLAATLQAKAHCLALKLQLMTARRPAGRHTTETIG